MNDPVKILYIAGAGRTGSTLLEKLLGQLPDVFSGGELTFLWGYAMKGRCSCGLPLVECPVWTAILTEAYGSVDAVDAEEMVALRKRFDSRYLPLMVTDGMRRRLLGRLGTYPETVERLYQAIATTTGCRVIVDSSKEPHYAYILNSCPGLDVYVLHLVRDPRAVGYSWSKSREQKGIPGSMMDIRRPTVSATYYGISNAATEWLWARHRDRYLRVRYEDFVLHPVDVVDRIAALVGEPIDLREVMPDGRTGVVTGTHSAWGNPNRFETGTIALRPDDQWVGSMSARARRTIAVLNGPFIARYGYSFKHRSTPAQVEPPRS
jgi:hypothetical protein